MTRSRSLLDLPLRIARGHPRLVTSGAVGTLVGGLLPAEVAAHAATRFLVAWNVFALLYLFSAGLLIATARDEFIRRRAAQQDDGRVLVLVLGIAASAVVLLAIGSQLALARTLTGVPRALHIGLGALTVVTGWAVTQVMFALHYAHDFFLARQRGQADVLQFPGTADPVYTDFLYFACVIGTSGQTADVALASASMRRIGLAHCVQAFFFNTTVLALTINLAASLF